MTRTLAVMAIILIKLYHVPKLQNKKRLNISNRSRMQQLDIEKDFFISKSFLIYPILSNLKISKYTFHLLPSRKFGVIDDGSH